MRTIQSVLLPAIGILIGSTTFTLARMITPNDLYAQAFAIVVLCGAAAVVWKLVREKPPA